MLAISPIAAYSTRKVVPTYSGPMLKFTRNIDSLSGTIRTDADGNILQLLLDNGYNLTDQKYIADWIEK